MKFTSQLCFATKLGAMRVKVVKYCVSGVTTRSCQRELPAVQGSGPDDLCAVIYDVVARKRARVLPRPVFTVSPDGALATSVDFIRLQKVRKGKRNADLEHRHCVMGYEHEAQLEQEMRF